MSNERKVALITGASGGIGRAIIKEFNKARYDVIAIDIAPRPSDLQCGLFFKVDLRSLVNDSDYAEKLFHEIKTYLSGDGLNALINNAATQVLGGIDKLNRNDWKNTLDVNLLAPYILIRGFLSELESVQGSVINMGSIHARLTKANFVAYATSKAAIAGMTRALAVDLGSRVRINAIEPAAIETDMLKAGFDEKPEMYRQLETCHPQKRIGLPDEVAKLAFAIVEGGFEFLHGACIRLDGGISGRLYDPD